MICCAVAAFITYFQLLLVEWNACVWVGGAVFMSTTKHSIWMNRLENLFQFDKKQREKITNFYFSYKFNSIKFDHCANTFENYGLFSFSLVREQTRSQITRLYDWRSFMWLTIAFHNTSGPFFSRSPCCFSLRIIRWFSFGSQISWNTKKKNMSCINISWLL